MTDGCTRNGALRRVVLPLCVPAFIATASIIFINIWMNICTQLDTWGGESYAADHRRVKPLSVEYV